VNKFLICEDAELLKNFPKLIKEKNTQITVISNKKSSLTNNAYIDKYVTIKASQIESFNDLFLADTKLITKLNGWIIWGNDEIMGRIATSKLPLSEKLRILPVKKKLGLVLLGSKVGQGVISNKLKLNAPKTVVAKNNDELKKYSSKFKNPFVVKADKFGGGAFIKKILTAKEKKELSIPKEWFPVIIQDFVVGQIISVEAFFKDGFLIAWVYSFFEDSLGEYGPSTSRLYKNPEVLDFELDLIHLARECGLDGMFNCTFILKGNKHYLIEADARPNSWQFLYSYFKLPILEIMTGIQEIPLAPLSPRLKNKSVKIIDLDRVIPYAISNKDYKTIFNSLMQITHSTQWIAGNKTRAMKVIFSAIAIPHLPRIKSKIFSISVTTFRGLPTEFQEPFKRAGITKFIAKKIFKL
jgi:hypothetical protein